MKLKSKGCVCVCVCGGGGGGKNQQINSLPLSEVHKMGLN